MDSHKESDIFSFEVDEYGRSNLLEMTRWTKFLAIVGYIMLAMLLAASIFGGFAMSSLQGNSMIASVSGSAILFIAANFYPVYGLYKYSTLMKAALQANDKKKFNEAIVKLKNVFKYFGILTLIFICLEVLVMLIGLLITMMR